MWYRPDNLKQALALLAEEQPTIVCGGTDLFVNWEARRKQSPARSWLDIQHIPELQRLEQTAEGIEIGAAVTAAELWQSPVTEGLAALREACQVVGGWQIQNRASIGGNFANASPAADMIVPLIAYGAVLTLASRSGTRKVAAADFVTGPKTTVLQDDEMITNVFIPHEVVGVPQTFLRHDQRGGTDISLVSVAAVVKGAGAEKEWIKIAVGAANATVVALSNDELNGTELTEEAIAGIARLYANECQPISDVRASAEYRKEMVKVFVKKALMKLTAKAGRES